jgi:hypothetical protein
MSPWWRQALGGIAIVIVVAVTAAGSSAAASPTLPSSDPFYSYSGPLGQIAPGTVLRQRTVTIAESGNGTPISATQVLYRTTGQLGQPTATVATILRSATQPLVTKLVSYQTAYDALGSQCDPSYTLQGGNSSYATAQDEEQIIVGYLSAGDTVVVPDYEGVRLDWAAGQESGYGTLDGIRAAENLLSLPQASTPVGMVGYSGGSIATDFAAELAPSYAPSLNLVGTAEGGLPVDFFHNLAYINGSPDWSGVIPAVLVSLSRAFGVSFQQYLSPYGQQLTNKVSDQCINDFVGSYPGLTYQKLLVPQYQDIYKIPPVVRIGDQLIMGRTGTPKGPMFMGVGNADGTGDGVMVTQDDQALAHTYCQRGVSVQFNVYNGDDHTQAAVPFEAGALSFLGQRLNGQPVANGCSTVQTGNSLDPLPVPGNPSAAPKVHLRLKYLGPNKRRHGVVIELATSTGTLRKLVVTLRHGHRLIARIKVGRVTTSERRLVLRQKGRIPRRGRYRLRVTQGRKTLLVRTLRIR